MSRKATDIISITIRNATTEAVRENRTTYVVPTHGGPRIARVTPAYTNFYEIAPEGDVTFHAYEPWVA